MFGETLICLCDYSEREERHRHHLLRVAPAVRVEVAIGHVGFGATSSTEQVLGRRPPHLSLLLSARILIVELRARKEIGEGGGQCGAVPCGTPGVHASHGSSDLGSF